MNCNCNEHIICSVTQCQNNDGGQYCSLNSIKVATHEANPTQCACTDCMSFVLK